MQLAIISYIVVFSKSMAKLFFSPSANESLSSYAFCRKWMRKAWITKKAQINYDSNNIFLDVSLIVTMKTVAVDMRFLMHVLVQK